MERVCSGCVTVQMNSSGGENNDGVCVSFNLTPFDHTYASYRVIDLEYEKDVARNWTGGGERDDGVDARCRDLRGLFQNLTSFDHIYANNQVIDVEHAMEEAQSYSDSDESEWDSDSEYSTESYFVASPEDDGVLPEQR